MNSPVLVALDYPDKPSVLKLVERLSPELCRLKVGKELFTRCGPDLVVALQSRGFEIFLDLKYHDIPNTVAGAVRAASDLGVDLLTVHASGGPSMLDAAVRAREGDLRLLAVTVLTSLSPDEMGTVWGREIRSVREEVGRLAVMAHEVGVDGVVASALEASWVRTQVGEDFTIVTPGIRPAGSDRGDQNRVATPADAVRSGADYLVIGRPITQADDPAAVLAAVLEEIAHAESED